MDGDQRCAVSIVGICAMALVAIIWSCLYQEYKIDTNAFEHGYSQQTLQGSSTPRWVKND